MAPQCAGWETALGRLWDGSGTAQYGCLRGTVIARQLKNFAAVAGHIPLPAQGYFSAFTWASARVELMTGRNRPAELTNLKRLSD